MVAGRRRDGCEGRGWRGWTGGVHRMWGRGGGGRAEGRPTRRCGPDRPSPHPPPPLRSIDAALSDAAAVLGDPRGRPGGGAADGAGGGGRAGRAGPGDAGWATAEQTAASTAGRGVGLAVRSAARRTDDGRPAEGWTHPGASTGFRSGALRGGGGEPRRAEKRAREAALLARRDAGAALWGGAALFATDVAGFPGLPEGGSMEREGANSDDETEEVIEESD